MKTCTVDAGRPGLLDILDSHATALSILLGVLLCAAVVVLAVRHIDADRLAERERVQAAARALGTEVAEQRLRECEEAVAILDRENALLAGVRGR